MATKPVKGETGVYLVGLDEYLRTLNRMSKEMTEELRQASTVVATAFNNQVRNSAASKAERALADAFQVYRDRVPKVGSGGTKRIAVSGNPKFGQFFYGVEFGGQRKPRTMQFRPHLGQQGYFFYPMVREKGGRIAGLFMREMVNVMQGEWEQGAAKARARF